MLFLILLSSYKPDHHFYPLTSSSERERGNNKGRTNKDFGGKTVTRICASENFVFYFILIYFSLTILFISSQFNIVLISGVPFSESSLTTPNILFIK